MQCRSWSSSQHGIALKHRGGIVPPICGRCRTTWQVRDGVRSGWTDEYTPLGADPCGNLEQDVRHVRVVQGPAHGAIRVQRWDAQSRTFTVEMSAPDRLALRLFRYPAWKVEVNGRVVETATREGTGQMLVPVEAGMNRVEITFIRTWDRTAGGWITFVTAICMGIWVLMARRRTTQVLGVTS